MKFTSEDLLKFMGLKLGDIVKSELFVLPFKVIKSNGIMYAQTSAGNIYSLSHLIGFDFEIIQPTPTLTEDEKVILRNVNMERIGREMVQDPYITEYEWLYLVSGEFKYDFSMYNHIFKSIEMCGEYSIEELLGEKV